MCYYVFVFFLNNVFYPFTSVANLSECNQIKYTLKMKLIRASPASMMRINRCRHLSIVVLHKADIKVDSMIYSMCK